MDHQTTNRMNFGWPEAAAVAKVPEPVAGEVRHRPPPQNARLESTPLHCARRINTAAGRNKKVLTSDEQCQLHELIDGVGATGT